MKRLWKVLAWILAVVMLCPALAAGETSEAVNPFDLVTHLAEAFDEHPAEGREFSDTESADAYILRIYGYIDGDRVKEFFYGGAEEAAVLLKDLSGILYGTDAYSDLSLEDAEMYYACVWAILHSDYSAQEKSAPYIKETMKGVLPGCSEKVISDATDKCFDYIAGYEPDLISSGYYMNTTETTIEGSSEYIEYYQKGVRLFDEGKYDEAIEAYVKCLEYQENDMRASFEIVEAYIALGDYASAKDRLELIAPYTNQDTFKAQWLRRRGFIAIEELDFDLANALYTYSLTFEKNSMAEQELEYIRYIAPTAREFTAEEAGMFLAENGMPFTR